MLPGGELVGYKQIRVTDELSRSVQRAGGAPLRRRETLGGLVKALAAQRGICRREDLIEQIFCWRPAVVQGRRSGKFFSSCPDCFRFCPEIHQEFIGSG